MLVTELGMKAQKSDSAWTLNKCITYALEKNIQVNQSALNTEINKISVERQKASRYPSLSASVGEDFSWRKSYDQFTGSYGSFDKSDNTSAGINSSMTLFSGGRINKSINQAKIEYEASQYDTETQKENITLNVLNAYLQVLYSQEQVRNSVNQVKVTTEQLHLANERVLLGAISQADFLQVKSELANEKRTLASAQSTLAINRLSLMQLMELPLDSTFKIASPQISDSVNLHLSPNANIIFSKALEIKPQIKSAELNKKSAVINEEIAEASRLPQLSLSAGANTGYSSQLTGIGFSDQLSNKISPSAGLNLSIPIYRNREIKSQIATAKIGTLSADLTMADAHNRLRKEVEQACVNVSSSQEAYDASFEQWNAANESFRVATEKYSNGLMNSVDFLIQKNNLISAENSLLQAKYNLIFDYKILDFYSGIAISL
jgi:outer membrane protein